MSYSTFTYTATGSQTSWSIPFSYMDVDSIKVYVDGILAVVNTDYTIDEGTKIITFASTPTAGRLILIKRVSDLTVGYTDFTDGSILSADDLDSSITQSLQISQELSDRIDSVSSSSGDGCLLKDNNLSDLTSVATARNNLGLGNSALLSVGTASGTVCAGDDSRLSGNAKTANNLSDLSSASTARTNLGLGSAATLSAGTAANNLVQLTSLAKLPAVDGSLLTNLPSADLSTCALKANNLSDLTSASTARSNLGLGTAAVANTGTSAGNVVVLDGNAKLPAIDGSQLTNLPSGGGDMFKADNLSGLASVSTARTNLGLGSAATLTAGTSANNLVQLDSSGKLPAVDGSQLTNLSSGSDPTALKIANNLSDLNNTTTARSNLGLGSAAVLNAGVNDANVVLKLDSSGGIPYGVQFTNPSNARSALGLGSAAVLTAGVNGANNVLQLDSSGGIPYGIQFTNASNARSALGLGSSAVLNAGTDPNNVVQLNASGYLPALNGSLLTNLPSSSDSTALKIANNLSDLNNVSTARTNLGLGSAATLTAGTSANNLVQLNSSGYLPAVNGSLLTNLPYSTASWTDYTCTVTAVTGSITSYTVASAKYHYINSLLVSIFVDITLTDIGTMTNGFLFSLPVSTNYYTTAIASEFVNTGNVMEIITAYGSSSTAVCRKYDLTAGMTNNSRVVACITYRI